MREDKVWKKNISHILEQDTCHTGTMSCYWNVVPFLILQLKIWDALGDTAFDSDDMFLQRASRGRLERGLV